MNETIPSSLVTPKPVARALAVGASALALLGAGSAGALADTPPTLPVSAPGAVTATLEQCVTSIVQSERSATFAGEMAALPGATRMAIRIDVEERLPGETEYHTVSAPGLGVWRPADAKVKVYKYLKQVTNLSSPASYRGLVRFRWQSARGHLVKRTDRLTARCLQPASPGEPTTSPSTSTGPVTTTP